MLFWQTYERHLVVVGLSVGFVFDLIIADRPDSLFNNLWLISYFLLAGGLIVVLNVREVRRAREEHEAHPLFLLFMLQVCFGALSSNLLALYIRSGTFAGSALFLGLLAALLIGNEFLRTRYGQLRFNVGIYYFLLLTYCVVAVPTFITHSISAWSFLFSGLVSLLLIGVFLVALFRIVLRGKEAPRRAVLTIVGTIFLVFNALYFMNVIPPVPLSLKDSGIYHSLLRRSAGDYVALYQAPHWYEFWRATSRSYTLTDARSAFCFSSVFAPTNLEAPIFHRWEKYDEETRSWQTQSRVSFPISGGRDDGYRGFSIKSALTPGSWRCNVETSAGALIGRISFEVVAGEEAPELSQTSL